MKTEKFSDEFEYFYLELPQADYLSDLDDIQIQDEHFEDNSGDAGGLSDEQVSKLAGDALDSSDPDIEHRAESTGPEQELFSDSEN